VNRLLDSPDVPEDVVQFLLWHEYLHLYLQTGHTPEFWGLERASKARGDTVRWRLTSPLSRRPTRVRGPLGFARGDMGK
jgi:hypothetical protein